MRMDKYNVEQTIDAVSVLAGGCFVLCGVVCTVMGG